MVTGLGNCFRYHSGQSLEDFPIFDNQASFPRRQESPSQMMISHIRDQISARAEMTDRKIFHAIALR